MTKARNRPPLMVRVLIEMGAGRIYEQWISDRQVFVHGECVGKRVTVNPAISVVDTLLHEILHRLEPGWSENYIRNRTTFLMRRMSDEQIQAVYAEYQKRVTKTKRPKRNEDG